MTTVRAQVVGEQVVLPRADLDRLLELARRVEEVDLQTQQDDLPALGLMLLAEQGGAFAWLADEEDVYTVDDLKVRYR